MLTKNKTYLSGFQVYEMYPMTGVIRTNELWDTWKVKI